MIPGMCCGTFGVGIRSGLYGWHEFVRNIGSRGLKQARKECANAVMALGNDVKSLVGQTSSRASSWEPPGKHFRHLTIPCQNQPRQHPSVATSDTNVQSSTVQSCTAQVRDFPIPQPHTFSNLSEGATNLGSGTAIGYIRHAPPSLLEWPGCDAAQPLSPCLEAGR